MAVAMMDNLPPETDCSYSVSTTDWIWTGTSQNGILVKILAIGMVFWLRHARFVLYFVSR